MSEALPTPRTAIALSSISEISNGSPTPDSSPERGPTPERRTVQILGFNTLFKLYEGANRPLWERLQKNEELSDQERKDAISYGVTLDGINRLTEEIHMPGQPALPEDIAGDEFVNTYVTPDGRTRKQREGLVTNHMTAWAQREIDAGNTDRLLALSRQIVWENSLPYSDLHTTPGSISEQDRIRQEAGAFIHDTGEGREGRNLFGLKIRDSQHPQGSYEHALEDWVKAENEVREREEYIIDPPTPTDAITFVNPPKYELDPSIEPREVHIPDVVETGPVRPGRVRSRRTNEEIRQWIVDLGGGVRSVGPVNVTSEYRSPAIRNIGDESAATIGSTARDVGEPSEEGARTLSGDTPRGISAAVDIIPDTTDTSDGASEPISEDKTPLIRVAPGFAGEAGVTRGTYGELLPPERIEPVTEGSGESVKPEVKGWMGEDAEGDTYDESGAFDQLKKLREGVLTGELADPSERAKREEIRAGRLGKLNFVKKWWDRANKYVKNIPPTELPKISLPPKPGSRAGLIAAGIGLVAIMAVLIDNCSGKPGQQRGEALPQQPDKPPIEAVVPEPVFGPEAVHGTIAMPVPPTGERDPQPPGLPKYDTKVEDFSGISGPQYVDGLAKDQIAQAVDPLVYGKEVQDARAEKRAVDPQLGGAQERLDKMRDDLIRQYGEPKGTAIFNEVVKGFSEVTKEVIDNRNPGIATIAPNGAILFTGQPQNLTLPDTATEAGRIYASAVGRIAGENIAPVLPRVTVNQKGNNGQ